MPRKRRHECCPNAAQTLEGWAREGGWRWRIVLPSAGTEIERIAAVYCPWCGVELNEWAKLQDMPARARLRVVE